MCNTLKVSVSFTFYLRFHILEVGTLYCVCVIDKHRILQWTNIVLNFLSKAGQKCLNCYQSFNGMRCYLQMRKRVSVWTKIVRKIFLFRYYFRNTQFFFKFIFLPWKYLCNNAMHSRKLFWFNSMPILPAKVARSS